MSPLSSQDYDNGMTISIGKLNQDVNTQEKQESPKSQEIGRTTTVGGSDVPYDLIEKVQ